MRHVFDTIKGKIVAVLLVFLSLSHVIGLLLYAKASEEASTLLHDALLAEHIALITRFAERLPAADREAMLRALSGPTVRIDLEPSAEPYLSLPEGSRGHSFEHLLGVFLNRVTHERIGVAYSPQGTTVGLDDLQRRVQSSAHGETDHLPMGPLADIRSIGSMRAQVGLADGSWLRFAAPLLTVSPFSPAKVGLPLAAMISSVLLMAAWVAHRWTQPLAKFVTAAERFGKDIRSPPLEERGPFEVRAAVRTLNQMQERIRLLVEDRTVFAAAIAHDLGTPITRLHLRAHEIEDDDTRTRMLSDLNQMRRMITATLDLIRLDLAEPVEAIDLASLVQSLCDDLTDAGEDVTVVALAMVTIRSKPTALRRALVNVLENAIKYGARARVQLTCTADDVLIYIDDDGPGIPDGLMEAAFQPFRRLTNDPDQNDGTGVGLSIARSIVRGVGGEITLTNGTVGLRVTVRLPRTYL